MVSTHEVSILDTTLRDGLQHEEHYMSLPDRYKLLSYLVDAGVKKLRWVPSLTPSISLSSGK